MLTSLFISLSLILTTLWGFVFWDVKVTLPVIIGLLLVACAIVLCLYTKGKDDKSVSWKWLLYVALAFLVMLAVLSFSVHNKYNTMGNMVIC